LVEERKKEEEAPKKGTSELERTKRRQEKRRRETRKGKSKQNKKKNLFVGQLGASVWRGVLVAGWLVGCSGVVTKLFSKGTKTPSSVELRELMDRDYSSASSGTDTAEETSLILNMDSTRSFSDAPQIKKRRVEPIFSRRAAPRLTPEEKQKLAAKEVCSNTSNSLHENANQQPAPRFL